MWLNRPILMGAQKIKRFRDIKEIDEWLVQDFLNLTQSVLSTRKTFYLALSGGNTPKSLFTLLANKKHKVAAQIPWKNIQVFWVDERYVDAKSEENNFFVANELLFKKLSIPKQNLHRIHTVSRIAAFSARSYEKVLETLFSLGEDALPVFDLVWLGMGNDGHTASIFPGSPLATHAASHAFVRDNLVVATWVEKLQQTRITLTPKVLRNADAIRISVVGEEKASVLRQVLFGPRDHRKYPVQIVSDANEDKVIWLIDRAAGKLLAPLA